MSTVIANRTVRGIRDSIPSGHVIGRLSGGDGPAELISINGGLANAVATALAPGSALSISTSGSGVSYSSGTLSVEWNAGTVNAIGTGLAINSGTLNPNYRAGVVSAYAAGLTLASGTLAPNYQAGSLTTIGANLTLTSGTLTATTPVNQWSAGTVTALYDNLVISSNTLAVQFNVLAATASTMDPANKNALVTLSNGNLTSTSTTSAYSTVLSTSSRSSGKFYFEVTVNSNGGTTSGGNGALVVSIAKALPTAGSIPGGDTKGISWDNFGTPAIIYNTGGGGLTGPGNCAVGSTLGVAVDIGNKNVWFFTPGTNNWDGNALDNPATNTGGANGPGFLNGSANALFSSPLFVALSTFDTSQLTVNFGNTAFVHAVPAGFSSWDVATEIKVDTIGAGLIVTGTTLSASGTAQWNAGTVSALGTGLALTSTTLVPNYQGSTLSTFHSGLTLTSGTLIPDWQDGTVTALGTASTGTLAISSGTLSATYNNPYSAGTLSAFHSGLTLTAGTLTPDWQSGSVSAIGSNLTLASGTLSANPSVLSSSVAAGSGPAITSGTPFDVTHIVLTAGTWLVYGNLGINPAGSTTISSVLAWISNTSTTVPTAPNKGAEANLIPGVNVGAGFFVAIGNMVTTVASSTTLYLSGDAGWTTAQPGGFGFIGAVLL